MRQFPTEGCLHWVCDEVAVVDAKGIVGRISAVTFTRAKQPKYEVVYWHEGSLRVVELWQDEVRPVER